MDFCAIDFETATNDRSSACEVGVCVVQDSKIIETKTWLIKPPSFPYFSQYNIDVHGIVPNDVKNSPTFDEIWYEIQEMMYGTLMIAHNASFDAGVLRACLSHYGIFTPKIDYLCSIQLAKKSWNYLPKYGLKHLAEYHQIKFKHHRAGADAEVCAKISLLAFEKLFLTSNDEVSDYMKLKIKKL
ncbi:DNA polymerase III subunit epsilon [Chryseobacterium glaciei]|uniref:DNA polymerase III subunit epsilon n=1 Tax=Chryseobacterium glaciei TaxID=1685010 RepID=A0A172XZS1_9FLAO|nr:3'-5' exonuclease [Chryseobacterium glaciei]ANF52380.1 DNA polymerase III subunit epsilon [Chryseobacterium glaciei]